jgi:hypothetical protein
VGLGPGAAAAAGGSAAAEALAQGWLRAPVFVRILFAPDDDEGEGALGEGALPRAAALRDALAALGPQLGGRLSLLAGAEDVGELAEAAAEAPPPPFLVLSGHAASLIPY